MVTLVNKYNRQHEAVNHGREEKMCQIELLKVGSIAALKNKRLGNTSYRPKV